MIRFHAISNADAAIAYFSKSDGYYTAGDHRQEWLGKGAAELGLSGTPDFEHFKHLIHGRDPHTGEQLTAKLIENRIPAWDVTASIPKGVTIALERGDARIQDALWAAARETMADLEGYATTRIRKGGAQDDRLTGNLVAFAVEHPETRPAKADNMPDPDRHLHLVVMNLTHDPVEDEWKAVKFRPIMDLRKFFDRRFDQRLASKLTDLGYSIETKYKADPRGGKRYFSWDIKGMPESVVQKFSRRSGEVEKLAAELGVGSAVGKDKLGATSRQFKRKDLTLADYRTYWDARVTPDEARKVADVIKSALTGQNPRPTNTVDQAVQFAVAHHFERRSVVDWHDLAITAMERSMGGAKPEEIEPEAKRQGVLLKNGEATTRDVLGEESRIIAFAREGRGTMRPLGPLSPLNGDTVPHRALGSGVEHENATSPTPGQQKGRPDESRRPSDSAAALSPDPATLSPEQQAMVSHVLGSSDRVVLVIGDAGTGKTHAVRSAFQAIDRPVEIIAPGAEASRGVLRREGFANADTVTAFLNSKNRQAGVRNGVIWVDEAGQLPIRDLSRLVDVAKEQNARLVLQGDPKQHRSVARDGNMLNVLQEFAGLPVGRLKDIRRQQGQYREAVAALAEGDFLAGYDKLDALGWIKSTPVFDHNKPLVDDYVAALHAGKSVLVVAPTHKEGDEITAEIRARLKEEGKIGDEERDFVQLRPLGWTDAEKGDLSRYDGTEVLQFHRNSGTFKAGDRVRVADWPPGGRAGLPSNYVVYAPDHLGIAVGDTIRVTANGKTRDGLHKLNNGAQYTVAGFTKEGDITLSNGWTLAKDFGHLTHGYVSTSHASQGRTVDRVLIAMGHESTPAISAEQFYVSVSRGREQATVYTGLSAATLRDAIQRTDARKSATELMAKPRRKRTIREKTLALMKRVRDTYERLRDRAADAIRERQPEREMAYVGR